MGLIDKPKMKTKALSLLEVTIATVILALIVVSLTNVFLSSGQWLFHMRARSAGGEVGDAFLGPLSMQVRQDQWDGTTCLTGAGGAACLGPRAVNGVTYTPLYTRSAWGGTPPGYPLGRVRKVVLTLTWPAETKF